MAATLDNIDSPSLRDPGWRGAMRNRIAHRWRAGFRRMETQGAALG